MREIFFRGKVADEPNEWVYGYLSDANTIHQIFDSGKTCGIGYFTIIPETVGQYTGLQDMNVTKIFEWDIVKFGDFVYSIEWKTDRLGFGYAESEDRMLECDGEHCTVIGNIYDNPELLESET